MKYHMVTLSLAATCTEIKCTFAACSASLKLFEVLQKTPSAQLTAALAEVGCLEEKQFL